MRSFLLGEEAAQVGVLVLREEFVMVDFGAWGCGRGEISLLSKQTVFARCVDLGSRSSWGVRSRPTTVRTRGRESKVDRIWEKAVYGLQSVICYTTIVFK